MPLLWTSFLAKCGIRCTELQGNGIPDPSLILLWDIDINLIGWLLYFFARFWLHGHCFSSKINVVSLQFVLLLQGPPTPTLQILKLPRFQSIIYWPGIILRDLQFRAWDLNHFLGPQLRNSISQSTPRLLPQLSGCLAVTCTHSFIFLVFSRALAVWSSPVPGPIFLCTFYLPKTSFYWHTKTSLTC